MANISERELIEVVMDSLKYLSGTPEKEGVYACRVFLVDSLLSDRFLVWQEDSWWHIGSSEKYRDEVVGWIGPLPRGQKAIYNESAG